MGASVGDVGASVSGVGLPNGWIELLDLRVLRRASRGLLLGGFTSVSNSLLTPVASLDWNVVVV